MCIKYIIERQVEIKLKKVGYCSSISLFFFCYNDVLKIELSQSSIPYSWTFSVFFIPMSHSNNEVGQMYI